MNKFTCARLIQYGEEFLQTSLIIVTVKYRVYAETPRATTHVFNIRTVYIRVRMLDDNTLRAVVSFNDLECDPFEGCVQ